MKRRMRVRRLQAPPTPLEERMIHYTTLLVQVNQLLMTTVEVMVIDPTSGECRHELR